MFTGLIEDVGTIKKVDKKGNFVSLLIGCNLDLTGTRIGDSIAIDGVCLTVVELSAKGFRVEVSPETLHRSNLREMRERRKVNLERALRLSDRLGGHIVLGHADGIGKIKEVSRDVDSVSISVSAPEQIMKYVIEKGSVAIDGISLTVNECSEKEFGITIIPHTASHTTLCEKNVGDSVNIENDIIGKYVERFLIKGSVKEEGYGDISMEFLSKHGFI